MTKALPQARADSAELVMNCLSIDAVQKGIVYQGLTVQHVCRYPGCRDGCDSEAFFTGLAQVIDSSQVNARAWGCDGARECGEPMTCGRRVFLHHSLPELALNQQLLSPVSWALVHFQAYRKTHSFITSNFLLGESRISRPSIV